MSDEKIIVKIDPDLEELIPGFLTNRAADLATLRDALAAENYPSLQSLGHSLKGVGGGYGFTGMSEIGAAIETAAKQQNLEELKGLVEQYGNYLASGGRRSRFRIIPRLGIGLYPHGVINKKNRQPVVDLSCCSDNRFIFHPYHS